MFVGCLVACVRKCVHTVLQSLQDLFHPHRESLGRLAILSPSLKHIRIEKAELWYRRPQQIGAVDVAVVQQCLEQEEVWPVSFSKVCLEFYSANPYVVPTRCAELRILLMDIFVPSPFQENR